MDEERFDRLVNEVDNLHADVAAFRAIIAGFCAALEKRDIPRDIIRDAFDFAETTERRAMGGAMQSRSEKTLRAIETLRSGAID